MNLLQCSSSLENKRSFKVIYVFKLGNFQALSWYHSKLLRSSQLYSEQRVNASHFSTHQAVNETITEVA